MSYLLTPSNLRLLKECPRCFWLQHNRDLKRPSSIYPSLPFGIDKALKERFDYYRENEKLPPELRKLDQVRLFDHPLLALWKNNWQGIRWKDEEGNELRGAVDDILEKNNKLIVLEYVTRGFPLKEDTISHYEDQLNFYTFLLQKNGFPTEDYAYLLFFHPKSVNWQGDIWFHKELHQVKVEINLAEELFRTAINVLKEKIPESSAGCEFCQWAAQLKSYNFNL